MTANALNTEARLDPTAYDPRTIDIFRNLGDLGDSATQWVLACEEVPWELDRLALTHDGCSGTTPVYTIEVFKVLSGITVAAAVAAASTYRIATAMSVSATTPEVNKQWTFNVDPAKRAFAAGDRLVISITRTGTTPACQDVSIRGLGKTWIKG